ncbi:MAG: hypothetical protein HY726_03875 [Candidatus Rokubacteria bacterium]|nr:hypothetical protein [Candidatus Rokubacteria bacterium]
MRSNHLRPIAILDEHPEWSTRLIAELALRQVLFEKIEHHAHAFSPSDREPRYSVIVNRTSPSSHTRGHGPVLFYAEPLLAYYESLGIPVINPVAAYRVEKSKALQALLFERLGLRYPKAVVVSQPAQIPKVVDGFRFPVLVKPNVGGSGAGILRADSREALEEALGQGLTLGPDGVALVQEYVEPEDGAIVRIEVMGGEYLYAIRIIREGLATFNLCPADLCQIEAQARGSSDLSACPADATQRPGLSVTRWDPPAWAIEAAIALADAAAIDVGGIEYLVGRQDGEIYFYDVNATSNFVANAPAVVGFDPTARFVDYILAVARGGDKRLRVRREGDHHHLGARTTAGAELR